MANIVAAELEIDGNRIDYYTSVTLHQKFNEHHEFTIRINHDVLETLGSFSMTNAQKQMGKPIVIRLKQMSDVTGAPYEFRGIICGVKMEQSGKFHGDLVITGYSPTILLENGQHFNSFYDQDLQKITETVGKPLSDGGFDFTVKTTFKEKIRYISQYRESSFNFLNRLSTDFSEWFYYDGKALNFGKPSSLPETSLVYGYDIHSMQLALRLLPMRFKNFSYISKDDKVETSEAPDQVDGLGQYASAALEESNNIFSSPVNFPLRQRVENASALKEFVKKRKASLAANLEVLTASSDNPTVTLGSIVNIKIVKPGAGSEEDYNKFLVTSVDHFIGENGKYYNSFEAIPSTVEVLPAANFSMPVAETQIATVMDNADPDNIGRIRIQMLWQQDVNQQTDWVRVMTPDAGGGKGGGKNRGLVVVPEIGDQVVVCFRYNDPDRPFVMGSLFHGKTGGGGGASNNIKSLNSKSGHTITLDDGGGITIVDKSEGNKIEIDGTDKITVTASAKITLSCGSSSITLNSDGKIDIVGIEVTVDGSTKATMKSTAAFKAEGTDASIDATTIKATGEASVDVDAPATTVVGKTSLDLSSDAMVNVEGKATTNVKGGVVNLN